MMWLATPCWGRAGLEAGLPIFADRAMSKPLYYLEDLHIGQRFKSGTHTLDAAQIKAFAAHSTAIPYGREGR